MASIQFQEEEIDDLIYLARVGDKDELSTLLSGIIARQTTDRIPTPADVLAQAVEESSKNTTLHMASANGHVGELNFLILSTIFLHETKIIFVRNRRVHPLPVSNRRQGSKTSLPRRHK